jgi:hypothetical protein
MGPAIIEKMGRECSILEENLCIEVFGWNTSWGKDHVDFCAWIGR